MSQKNSALQHIFVHADAVPKSGHRWVRQSGFLRRQREVLHFVPRWEIGSKLANRTIGYTEVKFYGPINGRRNKLLRAVITRKSADTLTMMSLIVNVAVVCEDSGVG